MPINTSLGYINEFVEHEGRKVIIVTNEQEIKDKEEYARRREKLIGKTFEVQSVLDEALVSFIELDGWGSVLRARVFVHSASFFTITRQEETVWGNDGADQRSSARPFPEDKPSRQQERNAAAPAR